jgi:hypothetical protein
MRDWTIRIDMFGMTKERADEIFEAVADLVHESDEEVACSMNPFQEIDDE